MNSKIRDLRLKTYLLKISSVSIVVGTLVSVFVISLCLFTYFFNDVFVRFNVSELRQYQLATLKDTVKLKNSLSNSAIQISRNTDITDVVINRQTGLKYQTKAIAALSSYKRRDGILNVYIVDINNNLIYYDESMIAYNIDDYEKTTNDLPVKDIAQRYGNNANQSSYIDGSYYDNEAVYVYKSSDKMIIIFKISNDYSVDRLMNIDYYLPISTLVFNENMEVIFGNNKKEALPNDIFERLRIDNNETTHMTRSGDLYIFTRYADYTCLSKLNYTMVIVEALKSASFIWVFIFVFLALILVVASVISHRFKNVVNTYLLKLNTVEEKYTNTQIDLNLKKLFNHSNLTETEKREICSSFNYKLSHYKAMMMQIDRFNDLLQDNSYSDINVYLNKIATMAVSAFGDKYMCKAVIISEKSVGYIINSNKMDNADICEYINNVNDDVKKYFGTTVSFSVGETYTSPEELIENIDKCTKSIRRRYVSGYSSIIFPHDDTEQQTTEKYPINIQKQISEAITEKNCERFSDEMEKFRIYAMRCPNTNLQHWVVTLFTNLVQVMSENNSCELVDLGMLVAFETFDEAIEYICKYVNEHMSWGERMGDQNEKNESFKSRVDEIVLMNYSNPDFNLSAMADMFNISPTHMGRKFRQVFNCSFSNYLNKQRLILAEELLKNSDKKIANIALFCGFSSVTYFNSVFKKYTKITPQEYRNMIKEK